jgi:signal transduction histidine kinase
MVLSFSPQGTFVLLLFQLVLSGLAFVVLVWIRSRQRRDESAAAIRFLGAGFALLTAAFATRALYCRLAVCPPAPGDPRYYGLLFSADLLRLLGASTLVGGYLLMRARRRWASVVIVIGLGLSLLVAGRFSADANLSVRSIAPFTTARAAEGVVLLLGAGLIWRAHALPAAAFLVLGLARLTAGLGAWRPAATELAWTLEHTGTLAAMVLLALALERESLQTAVRFFLRLNLTFIVLASSLILAVAEIERRALAEFAALQSEDLAEFVRGHMLYYTRRGEPPDLVVTHDDVIRKLVAEFGRYPDLRRVQVSLRGRSMALAIDRNGVIAQERWTGFRAPRPRVSPEDFAVASLVFAPIVLGGEILGRVDLVHSLERINELIGWQMQLVFGVFTLAVAVASLVNGMLVVVADRTIRRQFVELEKTRRTLSRAERLASIGSVADGVAHEINNPAGILVARADYLLSVTKDNPQCAEINDDLQAIRRQAQRIAKTVRDLLTFTRPGSLRWERVSLEAVIDAALELIRPMIVEKGIRLERLDLSSQPVSGDPSRLEQVFINLLINAVHATSAGGEITVGVSERPAVDEVEIGVRDTGSGIPPEHLERIFDPFFTTKEPGQGTGLGLSIVYGIVRDHQGAIDVVSTPGVGTEFRVRLPLADRRCEEAPNGTTMRNARIHPAEPALVEAVPRRGAL